MVTVARVAPQHENSSRSAKWIVGAVLLLVTLVTRGIWFSDPVPDFDEQLYSLIGWRMTQGDLPFVDLWDRKPFGLFAIFGLSHWLFGPGAIAYQLVASIAALGGAWLVYLLARDMVDQISATIAGALYLMLMAAYGSYSGQSEIFHAPLMLLMLWLVRDVRRPDAIKRALIAMLIGGVALQIKYTVLPQCVFFGGYVLWGQWRHGTKLPRLARLAAAFAALGVLPTALVAAFYAAIGQFEAFWFANFVSFFERAPNPYGRYHPEHLFGFSPLAVLLLVGLYAAFRLNPPRNRNTYILYWCWTLASVSSVLLPSTIYLYYFAALVPAAILVALPLIDIKSPAKWIPAALLLIGVGVILNLPDRLQRANDERQAADRLTHAVSPFVGSDENCLFVFDGPVALYRTTHSCLPTRFIYPDHLNNALERDALEIDQPVEVARILANRPGVIVTADRPMTVLREESVAQIEGATEANYRPLMTISLGKRYLTAWVRNDLAD